LWWRSDVGVVEIVKMYSAPGHADALEAGLEQGAPAIARHPSCGGVRVFRSVEEPDAFVLMAEWESVEAHTSYFDSPNSPEFRSYIEGLRDTDRVDVAHYVLITDVSASGAEES
jgi:quinol monooxygenase YgiN